MNVSHMEHCWRVVDFERKGNFSQGSFVDFLHCSVLTPERGAGTFNWGFHQILMERESNKRAKGKDGHAWVCTRSSLSILWLLA